MTDLLAKSPCDGLLPLTIGSVTVTEIAFDAITSLAPFKGQESAVSDALKVQMGAAFPKPNRTTGKAHARAVWSGVGQALVLGPPLAPIPGAAMTDQTDAWTCVALEGDGARDVLARLTPLDLRPSVFKQGHAARTEIAHMGGVLMRTGENRYGLMVFRSMAATLVHDLEIAMQSVAARGRL
ncbi:sarcosine oxidase subunit gamma [Marimonas lutisalis]|uniref:sarcosine oxidase subunit gamma n=1 Tax=Marimonas lutisalis TaxID=2545756 RepID=UPI0010F75BA9|nr:sarcosine oxidase subunit gamma family protein [Marimonas lutisalis]